MTPKKQLKPSGDERREQVRADRPPMTLSVEGAFLTAACVLKAKELKRLHVEHRHVDMFGNVTTRTFLPVSFFGRQQLADVVTGSLYEVKGGRCLAGRARLAKAETKPRLVVKRKAVKGTPFNNAHRKEVVPPTNPQPTARTSKPKPITRKSP